MNYSFLFPGQGSQSVGMGRDLYDKYECARRRFDTADAVVCRELKSIIFNGPIELLTATENAQPALFTIEAAITDILAEHGIRPAITIGHSLGEYGALYAAGVFSFEDGLRAVAKRGELMAASGRSSPGTMAAIIGMDKETLSTILAQIKSGIVVSANENSPDQIVISGEIEAIREACEKCTAAGAKRAIRLAVSGAFHSPLMQSAADALGEFLDTITFNTPCCPVISNVSALMEVDPRRIKELLVKQLTSPVKWVDCMAQLAAFDHSRYLEIGPKDTLKGLARKCNPALNIISCGSVANIYFLLS